LARESDEEKPRDPTRDESDSSKDGKSDKSKAKPKPVVIDFDGIDQRIVATPVPAGDYASLQAGTEGHVYYLDNTPAPARGDNAPRGATLHRFDLTQRKTET